MAIALALVKVLDQCNSTENRNQYRMKQSRMKMYWKRKIKQQQHEVVRYLSKAAHRPRRPTEFILVLLLTSYNWLLGIGIQK